MFPEVVLDRRHSLNPQVPRVSISLAPVGNPPNIRSNSIHASLRRSNGLGQSKHYCHEAAYPMIALQYPRCLYSLPCSTNLYAHPFLWNTLMLVEAYDTQSRGHGSRSVKGQRNVDFGANAAGDAVDFLAELDGQEVDGNG